MLELVSALFGKHLGLSFGRRWWIVDVDLHPRFYRWYELDGLVGVLLVPTLVFSLNWASMLAFIRDSLLRSRKRTFSAAMFVVTSVYKAIGYSVVAGPGSCLQSTRLKELNFVELCTCVLNA